MNNIRRFALTLMAFSLIVYGIAILLSTMSADADTSEIKLGNWYSIRMRHWILPLISTMVLFLAFRVYLPVRNENLLLRAKELYHEDPETAEAYLRRQYPPEKAKAMIEELRN